MAWLGTRIYNFEIWSSSYEKLDKINLMYDKNVSSRIKNEGIQKYDWMYKYIPETKGRPYCTWLRLSLEEGKKMVKDLDLKQVDKGGNRVFYIED